MHGRERERAAYAGARELLLEWNARQPAHPWRRRGAEPWLVLAAELSLERAGPVDQRARFESLAQDRTESAGAGGA